MAVQRTKRLGKIPIANLVRIAFYAGDFLEELDDCEVTRDDGASFDSLLQAMLARAAERIRLRGFERGYSVQEEVTARPRGRILFNESISSGVIWSRRLACRFDEFGADTLDNRILKACARALANSGESSEHQDSLRFVIREMSDVSDVPLTAGMLRTLPRSHASRQYRVVRFVARLLLDSGQPDERTGEEWARTLQRDEVRMRRVFERFVYRYLNAHAPLGVKVGRGHFEWGSTPQARMPRLVTDVEVRFPDWTRIIECKYTPEMLVTGPYSGEMYRPEHLRQLFAYLARARATAGATKRVDGLLLYPAVNAPESIQVDLGGFDCEIASLGLSEPWSQLGQRLVTLAFSALPCIVAPHETSPTQRPSD
jgi:5-methylcytosine-specific restriction endonuclease McrBC regulatory subunit McrC